MRNNDFIAEEQNEQNQRVMQGIRDLYNTRTENSASLARVREQLLSSAQSLPYNKSLKSEQTSTIPKKVSTKEKQKPMQALFTEKHPWRHRVGVIAAAILITLLVASTIAILVYRGQETAGKRNSVPTIIKNASVSEITLRPNWMAMVTVEGAGSQTITAPGITLPRWWGIALSCQKGHVYARVYVGGIYGRDCLSEGATSSRVIGPQSSFLLDRSVKGGYVQKIQITAPSNATWQLQFAKPVANQQLLTAPGSDWNVLYEEAGTGQLGMATGFGAFVNGKSGPLPKVWGIEYTCAGSGTFSIDLKKGENYQKQVFLHQSSSCDNTVHLAKVANMPGERLYSDPYNANDREVDIATGQENDWQMFILGCTNTATECQ